MTKRKSNAWRPEAITPEVLTKLEAWFMNSLTDEECCLYCDISPKTLYRYIEKNPEFWQRKEALKKKPNIQAKVNWIKKIQTNNYQASKEWLERKSRDEFSLKQFTDSLNTNLNLDLTPEDIDSMTMNELEEMRKKLMR